MERPEARLTSSLQLASSLGGWGWSSAQEADPLTERKQEEARDSQNCPGSPVVRKSAGYSGALIVVMAAPATANPTNYLVKNGYHVKTWGDGSR